MTHNPSRLLPLASRCEPVLQGRYKVRQRLPGGYSLSDQQDATVASRPKLGTDGQLLRGHSVSERVGSL